MKANDVLNFWFEEIDSSQRFKKSDDFDALIRNRFSKFYDAALACELFEWRADPQGRLAEIIVLDQFSRNMFRDDKRAFAGDPLALALAQEAVLSGDDVKVPKERRSFLYMPFMHSESAKIHEVAVTLFEGGTLDFEMRHKKIIDRFGRYPHRNEILERESTPEEIEFLKTPGSGF